MKGAALLTALAIVGCDARGLEWRYRVDDGLGEGGVVVATIREGACDGPVRAEQRFARGEGAMAPEALPAGEWAFEVALRDDGCRVVGYGCVTRELPLDDGVEVVVEVEAVADPVSDCEVGQACMDGVCEGEDADAGTPDPDDAGDRDGGPPDAGVDASIDAAVECDCEESTDVCEAGVCVPIVRAIDVAMGAGFGCAVGELRDGGSRRVYCWGNSAIGRLGTTCVGATEDPTRLGDLPSEEWVEIETAGQACTRSASGRVFCWGQNNRGQAGAIPGSCSGNTDRPTEVPQEGMPWLDVGVAGEATCLIRMDGQRFCLGRASQGRFGLAEPTGLGEVNDSPVLTDDGLLWSSLTGGPNSQFYGMAAASPSDPVEAYGYGWNDAGQVFAEGGGASPPRPAGLGVASFAMARGYACWVTTGDALACWGCRGVRAIGDYEGCQYGGLGLGDAFVDPDPLMSDWPGTGSRMTVDLASVTAASGLNWTCAVAAGRLHCWGRVHDGAIGIDGAGCPERDGEAYCSTPQPVDTPASDWVDVAVGSTQSCAIREGGRLYCWGWPLGDTSMPAVTAPVRKPLL